MKLSETFISILNSHGFCVDVISKETELLGTTYEFSRSVLGEKAFQMAIESGESMEEFIKNLEDKRDEYDSANSDDDIDLHTLNYGYTSVEEIINLAERWNEVIKAHSSSSDEVNGSFRITLNNDTTLFLVQNKEDETDVKVVLYEGVGNDINFSEKFMERSVPYDKLVDCIIDNMIDDTEEKK